MPCSHVYIFMFGSKRHFSSVIELRLRIDQRIGLSDALTFALALRKPVADNTHRIASTVAFLATSPNVIPLPFPEPRDLIRLFQCFDLAAPRVRRAPTTRTRPRRVSSARRR